MTVPVEADTFAIVGVDVGLGPTHMIYTFKHGSYSVTVNKQQNNAINKFVIFTLDYTLTGLSKVRKSSNFRSDN